MFERPNSVDDSPRICPRMFSQPTTHPTIARWLRGTSWADAVYLARFQSQLSPGGTGGHSQATTCWECADNLSDTGTWAWVSKMRTLGIRMHGCMNRLYMHKQSSASSAFKVPAMRELRQGASHSSAPSNAPEADSDKPLQLQEIAGQIPLHTTVTRHSLLLWPHVLFLFRPARGDATPNCLVCAG